MVDINVKVMDKIRKEYFEHAGETNREPEEQEEEEVDPKKLEEEKAAKEDSEVARFWNSRGGPGSRGKSIRLKPEKFINITD